MDQSQQNQYIDPHLNDPIYMKIQRIKDIVDLVKYKIPFIKRRKNGCEQ